MVERPLLGKKGVRFTGVHEQNIKVMVHYFEEVKEDFLKNLDVKDNTKKLYSNNLDFFKRWVVMEGRNIKYLDRADILAYKNYLINKGLSANTVDSYLKAVRQFYRYAEIAGEHENIAAGIRLKNKSNSHMKLHLEKEEVMRLLSVIPRDSLVGKRDYAMINLMLRSGFRCVEVSRLRINHINKSDSGYIVEVFRKGEEVGGQLVGLTHKAIDPIIDDYLPFRGVACDDEFVFLTHSTTGERQMTPDRIGRIVKSYMVKSGIYSRQKTSHSLRHTAAVMALLNGADIKAVQQMLGHRRIETTEIYLESINGKLRLDNPAARTLDEAF